MVTAAADTAVSQFLARRHLRLAADAESRSDDQLAREQFLQAIRHDPSPEAGLDFGRADWVATASVTNSTISR
jgi:hypothetical protein